MVESLDEEDASLMSGTASFDDCLDRDQSVEVSVVLPCLNEARTLASCIRKARESLRAANVAFEIIVADNGSDDGSQTIAEGEGARLINVTEKGYGHALIGGIAASKGKYVIMGDSDDSYDFSNLAPFVERLREGYDLVMGNRFRGGIEPGAMPFLHRYLGNPVLSAIGRVLFRTPIHDFHCGLRGFSRDAANRMGLRCGGMEFASEMIVKASLLNMSFVEVPTKLKPDGRDRPPHLRTWRDGWRHLRFLLCFSPNWLFVWPGIVSMLIGIVVMGALVPGPLHVRGIVFDVHTMMFAAALVLIGFNSVSYGFMTRIYSHQTDLMPVPALYLKLFRIVTLETGLLSGMLLIVTGLVLAFLALGDWASTGWGALIPSVGFRMVIPSALALVLGVQVLLTSFFLSILGMARS